jgi:hypothetical protein
MRLNRSLMTGLTLVALVPAAGRAQEGHLFNNSWFWGAGGGALTYWTATTAHAQAPTVSLDWLITRTHFALYMGFDQSFFTANNLTYTDVGRFYTDTTLTNFRNIEYYAQARVRNSRHLQAALMAFPGSGHLRPYAGLGISANFVQGSVTTSAPPALLPAAQWFPNFYEDQFRLEAADWISPVVIAGLQAQLSRFSVYGQAKLFPGNAPQYHQRFFTDQGFFMLQAGVRINFLSALDRSW